MAYRFVLVCGLTCALAGCGPQTARTTSVAPDGAGGRAAAPWPRLCFTMEDADCWRPHYPVTPCDAPVHPELIGLWGRIGHTIPSSFPGDRFMADLIWDGCYATVWIDRITAEDTEVETLDDLRRQTDHVRREALGLPGHRHYHRAHRIHVEWRDDVMFSDSELTDAFPIARPIVDAHGGARWGLIRGDRTAPLTRFHPPYCLDPVGHDLLCTRDVVRRSGEWLETSSHIEAGLGGQLHEPAREGPAGDVSDPVGGACCRRYDPHRAPPLTQEPARRLLAR